MIKKEVVKALHHAFYFQDKIGHRHGHKYTTIGSVVFLPKKEKWGEGKNGCKYLSLIFAHTDYLDGEEKTENAYY